MKYGIFGLLFIFLIIIGAVALFRGGGNDAGPSTRFTKVADFSDNSAARVSWTIQGELVGEDQRKAVRVTISRDKRVAEVLDGYEERVEKVVEFDNTDAAFDTFTRALDNLSFGRERRVAVADERGVCPTGNRFVYRVTDGSEEVMRTWSTSCNKNQGPFGGSNAGAVARLFRQQITDYNKFVSGVRL